MNKDLKHKKSDYLLELALEEQLERDEDMLKYKAGGEDEDPHDFSEGHNRRMQEIFKMAEKVEQRPKRIRRFQRMAAGFAVLICVSTVMVTQVEAFRVPISQFFVQVKEKSSLFGVKTEIEQSESKKVVEKYAEYEPGYVPEGFEISEVIEKDGCLYIKYANEEKQLDYGYWYWEGTENMAIDTEDGETVETYIDGNKVYVIQKEGILRIFMYKSEKQFYIGGTISYEDGMKIMESIK